MNVLNIVTSAFTISASGIAIYIFIFKRKSIRSIFSLLLSYSFQITQGELKDKLEKLNNLNANDVKQKEEVINILNDIEGQIKGNSLLTKNCGEILKKLMKFNNNTLDINEPKKRGLVSEIRENLRNVDLKNFDEIYQRKL